jgi:hypothetical protein
MNGSIPPLGSINEFIATHVPFAVDVFSNPYMFGGLFVTLGYAFLLGYALTIFWSYNLSFRKQISFHKVKSCKYLVFGLMLFLIVGLYAFPLWNGDVIYPGNDVLASNRYSVPSYYYAASSWLNTNQSDFRLFALPYSIVGYDSYTWPPKGFSGPDPTEALLGKVLVSGVAGGGIGEEVANTMLHGSTGNVGKLMSLMNVKYILFHNDTNWVFLNDNSWYVSATPEQIQSILNNNQTGLSLDKTFGELYFYENNYWQPMAIYPASTSILSNGNLDQLTQIAERNDFTPNASVIVLSDQLNAQQNSALPMNAIFVQNPVNYQLFATARYYSTWKGVISTNGTGDPGMIIFPSPSKCPYLNAFPMSFTNWSAYDSTLIYLKTNSSALTIDSLTANGLPVPGQAWWQTGTSWTTGWPITIPPNQNAIIQLNQQASNIKLQTNNGAISLSVTNGWQNPLTNETLSKMPTTIVTAESGDYLLAVNATTGSDYGNLSVKVDNQYFSVDLNSQKQGSVFSYKYIGPIFLNAGSHTLTTSQGNASTLQIDSMVLYSLKNAESFVNANNLLSSYLQNNVSLTYEEINPTQYTVHVNASSPFYLVFSESYDDGWVATINGQQIHSQYHFTANGYANGWYVNKTGTYTITLDFTPQNFFYAGAAVSITTLIICSVYISKNKIKNIIQRQVKKKSQQ